jgi:hypothetical protein
MYSQASTRAQDAFARGDQILQLSFPLTQQAGRVGPTGGYTSADRTDVNADLNRVVNQGWALVAASVAFVPSSTVSRDKFLTSGQQTAVSGEVVGYFVFARDATKRRESAEQESQADPRHRPVRARRTTGEIQPLNPLVD